MKLNILLIAIIMHVLGSSLGLKAETNETLKFITSGNCYTCKLRIEAAVKELPGIVSVSWDSEAKITTVTFDKTQTDIYTIMKKIGSVGHDTEWYKGDDLVYNTKLVGSCCEYPRTLTYDDVKIGYLSLMDQWVSVETNPTNKINLYSANNGNSLNYNITGYDNSPIAINIYSLTGEQVYRSSNITSFGVIDLSSISSGAYLVIMTNQNKTIFQQKIIK
ncbi:MAG: cation transporter [bacterium]